LLYELSMIISEHWYLTYITTINYILIWLYWKSCGKPSFYLLYSIRAPTFRIFSHTHHFYTVLAVIHDTSYVL